MAYSGKEAVWIKDYTLSANRNLDLEVRNCSSGSVALVWSDAAATDAVVKLQASLDQTTFFDISGATQTLSAASGTKLFEIADVRFPYIRAVLTKNSETTAVLTLRHYFKGAH